MIVWLIIISVAVSVALGGVFVVATTPEPSYPTSKFGSEVGIREFHELQKQVIKLGEAYLDREVALQKLHERVYLLELTPAERKARLAAIELEKSNRESREKIDKMIAADLLEMQGKQRKEQGLNPQYASFRGRPF